jgi:GTPase
MQNAMQLSKIRSMIISFLLVLAVALLFSCSKNVADVSKPVVEDATAANASSNSSSDNIIHAVPFETTLFVTCANGGAGEDVVLTGFTNFIYQMIWTDHAFTLVYHDNVHNVTGVGVSSGETFIASGGTNGTVLGSWLNSQWIGTTIRQMRVIGQNTSFTITYKYHITVTSDGTVIVNSREQTADCD